MKEAGFGALLCPADDVLPPQVRDCYGSALWDKEAERYKSFALRGTGDKVGTITFDSYSETPYLKYTDLFGDKDRKKNTVAYECILIVALRLFEYERRWADGLTGSMAGGREVLSRVSRRAYALVLGKVKGVEGNVRKRVGVMVTCTKHVRYFDDGDEMTIVLI